MSIKIMCYNHLLQQSQVTMYDQCTSGSLNRNSTRLHEPMSQSFARTETGMSYLSENMYNNYYCNLFKPVFKNE